MKINKKLEKLVSRLIKSSLGNRGEVEEKRVKNALGVLNSLPRERAIVALSDYLKKIKSEIRKNILVLESSLSLDKIERENIIEKMKGRYFFTETEEILNPALLGGVRVKIADWIYDDSLEGKIYRLGEAIKN